MKLYELNFTLLRKFEELEGLLDLLNQMALVKGNHLTVSVKSEKDVNFVEIYLYHSSEIPLIGIMRDLEFLPSEETLKHLTTINFKKVFLKFNITDSKNLTIDIFDSVYEYVPKNKEKSCISTIFDDTTFEELFYLDFKIQKPFYDVSDLVLSLNSMLANNYFSFVELSNKDFDFRSGMGHKSLTLNFFTTNLSRPSLLLNTNLHGEPHCGNMTKYNMLCSQSQLCCNPECSIQVYITALEPAKRKNVTLRASVYLYKYSELYEKVKNQCELIDFIS